VNLDLQLSTLKRGVVDLHTEPDLRQRLQRGKPLRIKAGFDPTRPDLHLGHTVLMRKMRDFQDLGHEVVFVVGDFTAMIGDPSGRNLTRPKVSAEEVRAAAQTYAEQAYKVLDREKTKLVYNSEWLNQLNFSKVIELAGRYTLARMMEREDFKTRYANHASISLHELLYPLAQAYDSVHLACDVELGGSDQLFNLLVGREIMREYGLPPQIVMTTPLLEGINARVENGVLVGDKMSKSLDNYVGVDEPATEQFGKLMSICDDLMWRYYELLSRGDDDAWKEKRQRCLSGGMNPRDAKIELAMEIVAQFHDEAAARQAREAWESQFSARHAPQNMTQWEHQGEVALMIALSRSGAVSSSSEARRRLEAGAVRVDGERVTDVHHKLAPRAEPYEIKAGKRDWVRVIVRAP
jgi:tyrosyl-tRNA synthetase